MTEKDLSRLLLVAVFIIPQVLHAQDLTEDIEQALLEAALSNSLEQVQGDTESEPGLPPAQSGDADGRIRELEATLQSSGEAMKEVEMQLREERKVRARIEGDLKNAREQVDDLNAKLKAASGRSGADDGKALRKQVKDLEKQLKQVTEKRQDAEAALAKSEELLAEKEETLSSLSKDKAADALLKQVAKLQADLAETAGKLKEAEDQLSVKDREQGLLKDLVERQRKDLDARIADLEKVASAEGQDSTEAEKTIKTLTKKHAKELQQAADRVRELENEIAGLKASAEDSRSGALKAAEKRVEMVSRELEDWKDRNIKAKADFLKTEQDLKDQITALSHEKKRLSRTVEEQADQNKILKNMVEDRGDDLAKRLKAFEEAAEATAEKITQLNEELAAGKDSLRAAREAQSQAEARVKELEEDQPELAGRVEKLQKEIEDTADAAAKRIDALNRELAAGKDALRAAREAQSQAEARARRLETEKPELAGRVEKLEKEIEDAADAAAKRIDALSRELAAGKDALRLEREAHSVAAARVKALEKSQPLLSETVNNLQAHLEKMQVRASNLAAELEKVKGERRDEVATLKASLAEARKELQSVSDALEGRKRVFAFLASSKPDSEKSSLDRVRELKEDAEIAAVAVDELKEEIRRLRSGRKGGTPQVRPTARPPVAASATKPVAATAANPERERLLQRLMAIRKQYEAASANADQIKRKLIDELKGSEGE